jgi:adenylate kinase family enzyme
VQLPDRIHLLGASGSGTTTLGRALARRLGHTHLDTDRYFWIPTDPPFQQQRAPDARRAMLAADLDALARWVLSGSLCVWGDVFIPRFELVIFLHIPPQIRMERLAVRERERYGAAIEPGGAMHREHEEFIAWAAGYDTGDESMRSLKLHERWLAALPCRWIRIEGDLSTETRIARIESALVER